MTLADVADRTRAADPEGRGLSIGMISGLLGRHHTPSPRAMELLAAALDEDPWIFAEYQLACARAALDERGPGGLPAALKAFGELAGTTVPIPRRVPPSHPAR